MHKVVPFVTFAVGAAIGSVVTWQLVKTKYEQIAQEEIDSVKEVFSNRGRSERAEVATDKIEKAREERENIDIKEYATELSKTGYTNYSEVELVEKAMAPYVITPDEFAELEDYETVSLTFWADKVLTDDNGNLIEDVEGAVGFESLSTFGQYEEDSVFVRNDYRKCDYEILLDMRRFDDYIKTEKPYRAGAQ